MKLGRIATLAALSLIFALPSQAGEIIRPSAAMDFQWSSTTCRKPIQKTAATGQDRQTRLMDYATQIELYIDCIQREAQADFQRAQEDMQAALERDLEKEVEVMNAMMVRAAKTMR